jgi:hypothetical protein
MSILKNPCIAAANSAAGRELSEAEAESLFARAHARIHFYKRAGMAGDAAATRAGQELGTEILEAAIIETRNAALNVLRRQALDGRVVPGMESESVRAVLSGSVRGTFRGAADSVDANYHGLRNGLFGGLVTEIKAAGLERALTARNPNFERAVARELWRLRDPEAGAATGDAHAVEAARILGKYQEAVRGHQNEAGAWIGKLDQYITRQSHDQIKVRGNGSDAAFQAWRDFILPRLDDVTFRDAPDPEQLLRNVWLNLSSGLHTTSTSETLSGFKGTANLGKKVSQERVLHFKSADDWLAYNDRFGRGGVFDAVLGQIDKGARDTALMRVLGTNPEAMLTAWTDRIATGLRDAGKVNEAASFANQGFNQSILRVLDGRAAAPGNVDLARIGAIVRHVQEMAKLGGVVLSSIPDLAVNAATLRHNGIGLFDAYAQQMRGLLPRGAAEREMADLLGAGIDNLLGDVMSRFRTEGGALGRAGRASEIFYKLTGLNHWTESLKSTAGLMLSSHLAGEARQAFSGLNPLLQATLRRYGIESAEWDAMRATAARAADGRSYLVPADIADAAVATKFQNYLIDQVREGMTEANAASRAIVTMGTQRGTASGELVRTLMQFKTYAATFLTRTLGRELTRNGVDVGGVAHLVVATTALGYLAMTLKELAKGRNPRSPEDVGGYSKLVAAAMVQGGGLGIYGDFLFGEANRMGGGFIGSLAGPTAGTVEELHGFLANRLRGEGHTAAEAIQFAKNQTPFINLFYTRAALDHLIIFRAQEWANPGYLRRYEQTIKRQNNQTFWLRPSEAAR